MAEKEGWQGFLQLCLKAKTPRELGELFELFLTPEERDDLSTRHLIVQDLVKGDKTQREMAKELGVSIAKITRGSNSLRLISQELRKLLERV